MAIALSGLSSKYRRTDKFIIKAGLSKKRLV